LPDTAPHPARYLDATKEEAQAFTTAAKHVLDYVAQHLDSSHVACDPGIAVWANRLSAAVARLDQDKSGFYKIPSEAIEAIARISECATAISRHVDLVRLIAFVGSSAGTFGLLALKLPILAWVGYGAAVAATVIGPSVRIPLLED